MRIALALLVGSWMAALAVACGSGGGDGGPPPRDIVEIVFNVDVVRDVSAPDVPVAPPPDVPPDVPIVPCGTSEDCAGKLDGEGPCWAAVCTAAGACLLEARADGTGCDDADACTTASACSGGVCVPAAEARLDCDDGNACTTDGCERETGCTHTANALLCNDGRQCTEDDRCREGVCRGVPLDCDDRNPCSDDVCREGEGCVHTANRAPCDDRDACTANEACSDGVCRAGTPISCDDGNPCTNDSCQSVQGCRHTNNALPCEDSNPCTVGDQCVDGACLVGTYSPACPACTTDFECRPFDDDNPCNGVIVCAQGQCRILDVTVVRCEPSDDPCSRAACDPATGACVTTSRPDGAACDDGDRCTLSDACAAGVCVGTGAVCDDGDPCTVDGCDALAGCTHAGGDGTPCDDGDPCTGGDACQAGLCAPGPEFLCVACTIDADCAALDDGDRCNGTLRCDDGTCQLDETSVVTCDTSADGPCRETLCVPASGDCVTTDLADGTACDDGVRCTRADACAAGVCVGTPVSCEDDDPCTIDSCEEATGSCVNGPSPGPCEDGDPCTTGDRCVDGVCLAGEPTRCDDQNPCTAEICTPLSGCQYTNVPAPCDDEDACTTGDRCVDGGCVGDAVDCDDGNVCTQDSCRATTGTCGHTPVAGACDDGDVCTEGDACANGQCVPGAPAACDDGNPCTAGQCIPGTGCQQSPVAGSCQDGNACTTGDRCVDGECVGDGVLGCDDTNDCTDDGCDPLVGCTHAPNANPCDDANRCTTDDRCEGGQCRGGPPADCADPNVCTDDGCLPATGCTYVFNTAACDDGNPCTQPDQCQSGQCRGGAIVCTEDQCGNAADDDTDGATDCDDPDCLDVAPCLPCEPVEPLQCAATWGASVSVVGSTLSPSATDDLVSYPCATGEYRGREYAYVFESRCNQQVVLEVSSRTPGPASAFLRLRAFQLQDLADRCDARTCLQAGTMEQLSTRSRSQLRVAVRKGERYYFVVDGAEDDQGAYDLFLQCNLLQPEPFESDCADGCDSDGNGYTDCEDPACGASPACP